MDFSFATVATYEPANKLHSDLSQRGDNNLLCSVLQQRDREQVNNFLIRGVTSQFGYWNLTLELKELYVFGGFVTERKVPVILTRICKKIPT